MHRQVVDHRGTDPQAPFNSSNLKTWAESLLSADETVDRMDRVPRTTEGSNSGQDNSRLEVLVGDDDSLDQQTIMESFEFYVIQLKFGLVFSSCSYQD